MLSASGLAVGTLPGLGANRKQVEAEEHRLNAVVWQAELTPAPLHAYTGAVGRPVTPNLNQSGI